MSIGALIFPKQREQILESLRKLLDKAPFSAPLNEDPEAAMRRTYAQLKVLNDWAGSGRQLLDDPTRYFTLLEFAIVVNPSLFHIAQVHYGVCLRSALMQKNGTREQDLLIDELDRLDSVASILITELGNANSHVAIQTEALYNPENDTFILKTPAPEARKFMPSVGLSGIAKTGLIFARLRVGTRDHGTYPFLVRLRDGKDNILPGAAIHPIPGSCSIPMDHSMVSFESACIPRSAWLAESVTLNQDGTLNDPLGSSDKRLLHSLSAFRSAAAATSFGASALARASVFMALNYAGQRLTLGKLAPKQPILTFQAHQRVLFCAMSRAIGSTCLIHRVMQNAESSTTKSGFTLAPWASVHRDLGITKAISVSVCEEAIAACRRVIGAQSSLTVNRMLAYEDMLGAYQNAGGDNNLILFDAGQSMASGIDYHPPEEKVIADDADLSAPETLLTIASQKERLLYLQLLESLPADDSEKESLDYWNGSLSIAAALARAYGDRLLLESLLALCRQADTDDASLLQAMATLYTLDRIRAPAYDRRTEQAIYQALNCLMDAREKLMALLDTALELKGVPIASHNYIEAFT